MSRIHKYKNRPQRTIITRSFNSNIDLLNKLINPSEIPDTTTNSLQSNMSPTSSSADNENMKGYGSDKKIHFDSSTGDFKTWITRMKLRIRKLKLTDTLKSEEPDEEKNLELYMEIVEHIDDRSLRLIQDVAEDNGKLAWKILCETYLGNDEDRIFKVLTDFSNLSHNRNEPVIDYLCRIDEIKKTLESNEITLPDNLYVIMAMKGLSDEYDILCDVIQTQKSKPTFEEFKSQIKAKEIRISDAKISSEAKIMSVEESVNHIRSDTNSTVHRPSFTKHDRKCYNCFKYGHYANECDVSKFCERCRKNGHVEQDCKSSRYCDYCKTYNHLTDYCWYKPQNSAANTISNHLDKTVPDRKQIQTPAANFEIIKLAPTDYYDFVRTKESCPEAYPGIVEATAAGKHAINNLSDEAVFKPPNIWHVRHQKHDTVKYLLDSGATHHIISDKSKFESLDYNFDPKQHNLLLANGSTEFGKVQGRGIAKIMIRDTSGNPRKITLSDALYVPTYTQNIVSAICLANNGMEININRNGVQLRDQNKISYVAECNSGLAFLKVEH